MSDELLQRIQRLQFTDKQQAERLLLEFLSESFGLTIRAVELRPLAVSLNSFNGFLTLEDGRRLFFKTHVEPDSAIDEYYNAQQLADAGYPILQPIYRSGEVGRQILIYPAVDHPSVFDAAWAIETGQRDDLDALAQKQRAADDLLCAIYERTLAWQSAAESAQAPIHQLFYHRLTGGRLARFYPDEIEVALPDGRASMGEIKRVKWVINGIPYADSLNAIIANAGARLNPARAAPSVIGHGDAHNGNIFLRSDGLLYFDPAFAGRHAVLLDLAKPLFHNVFAMWMYFPNEMRSRLQIALTTKGDLWHVDYDYPLHPVRMMFFESKVERVLHPILRELQRRGWLDADWRSTLRAALFCCPFLTMNLADDAKFPPEIRLLGLSMAVEMGSECENGAEPPLLARALQAGG
jgi:hypothetical protein